MAINQIPVSLSSVREMLMAGSKNLPPDTPLPLGPPDLGPMPYVFIGDEAFPLKTNLMRPFPGHNLPEA